MKKTLTLILTSIFLTIVLFIQLEVSREGKVSRVSGGVQQNKSFWFILYRKSNQELLYFGEPGNKNDSALIKVFRVKSGIPNQRPTPLPNLLGRDYWLITQKFETADNPETSPYFSTLNIPVDRKSVV